MSNRTSVIERSTTETRVRVRIDLDGSGTTDISTGVGFFDRDHGQTGAAPNNIELHPVLSIRFR